MKKIVPETADLGKTEEPKVHEGKPVQSKDDVAGRRRRSWEEEVSEPAPEYSSFGELKTPRLVFIQSFLGELIEKILAPVEESQAVPYRTREFFSYDLVFLILFFLRGLRNNQTTDEIKGILCPERFPEIPASVIDVFRDQVLPRVTEFCHSPQERDAILSGLVLRLLVFHIHSHFDRRRRFLEDGRPDLKERRPDLVSGL